MQHVEYVVTITAKVTTVLFADSASLVSLTYLTGTFQVTPIVKVGGVIVAIT